MPQSEDELKFSIVTSKTKMEASQEQSVIRNPTMSAAFITAIPEFDGTDRIPVDRFLEVFESYSELAGWKSKEKNEVLRAKLAPRCVRFRPFRCDTKRD